MKSKILLFVLITSCFSLSSLCQNDSLSISSAYGFSESDQIDSSIVYNSIEVTIYNIDTLNWQLVQFELVDVASEQVLARKIVNRNHQSSYNTPAANEISLTLAVLPKSDYKILAKVRHIGGVESQIIETVLSNE